MLKKLAKEGNAFVGGTYLAQSGQHVYNTFVLATPSGEVFTPDKDLPSAGIESSFYAGGEDDEFIRELTSYGLAPSARRVPSRPDSIESGVFPVARPLFMFTNGWPTGETVKFLNYVLNPKTGQSLVREAGYVPLY